MIECSVGLTNTAGDLFFRTDVILNITGYPRSYSDCETHPKPKPTRRNIAYHETQDNLPP